MPERPVEELIGLPLTQLNREEIMRLFTYLNYTDPEGHPLENAVVFRDLVERATPPQEDLKFHADPLGRGAAYLPSDD